jgi:hypothetical protein
MAVERFCIVGLDEPETTQIRERVDGPLLLHSGLPRTAVHEGRLLVQSTGASWLLPVSKVVFHGIFERDFDVFAGLALWGGPCLPSARALMDCRLRIPCLVRALEHTRFGGPKRRYCGPGATIETDVESVAKWGNWHCSENKARFRGEWTNDEACVIEPFMNGCAVRVTVVGGRAWQIRMGGADWLQSIHHQSAEIMEADAERVADTFSVGRGLGLQILANDYIVGDDGSKFLLETNHAPNVTRFPEIWGAYRDYVVDWLRASTSAATDRVIS